MLHVSQLVFSSDIRLRSNLKHFQNDSTSSLTHFFRHKIQILYINLSNTVCKNFTSKGALCGFGEEIQTENVILYDVDEVTIQT